MKIIRTEKIILNGEKRLRLYFDPEDLNFVSLITKLPDCRWSPVINSWHMSFQEDHIGFLNKSCPDDLLFIDITHDLIRRFDEEVLDDKRVFFNTDPVTNRLQIKALKDNILNGSLMNSYNSEYLSNSKTRVTEKSDHDLQQVLNYLIRMNYKIIFKANRSETNESKTERQDICCLIEGFRNEMLCRSYSQRTIGLYLSNVRRFLNYSGSDSKIDADLIISFVNYMSMIGHYSRSSQNQVINSITLFLRLVHKRELGKAELIRPRRDQSAPVVLSEKEIGNLIKSIHNFKHRIILIILYQTGIRPSELREIRLNDVDFNARKIHIYGSAVNPARNIFLSQEIENILLSYLSQYLPERYLFEGEKGKPYSVRSLQKIFHSALKKANLTRKASIYCLRHSYAARLLESGTDPEMLKYTMGHRSSYPAEVYSRMMPKQIAAP